MLALGVRYLTGYAVATDVSGRERAEWPPHPARVFMAMAAAVFETDGNDGEVSALKWLEGQGPPALRVSDADSRDVCEHYVPVNDLTVPGNPAKLNLDGVADAMKILPLLRSRQPRTFPRVRPMEDIVCLVWPLAEPEEPQRAALESVCQKVTRVGHSSSLVQMWIEPNPPACNMEPAESGGYQLRIAGEGTVEYLAASCNKENIEAHAVLAGRVETAGGAEKKRIKQELLERFGENAPISLRPSINQWQAYRRVETGSQPLDYAAGVFDDSLLVLAFQEGPAIGLESTWALLSALHKTMLSACDPPPEWLSGHAPDGTPSQMPHVALLPLAFVGRKHADGHLMGVALAFPKEIPPRVRGQALRGLLYDENGKPRQIELRAGRLGSWTLARETRPSPPLTLQVDTWTGSGETWASMTPVVLDRHPKVSREKDRVQWTREVAEIVSECCRRQGLPQPVTVDVDKTSWHTGAPRAVAGKGSGYPLMPVKEGQNSRQQVHVWIRFPQPVKGPLLLGAGRYRGYGLCRPLKAVVS